MRAAISNRNLDEINPKLSFRASSTCTPLPAKLENVTVHDVLTQLHTHLSVALRVEDVDNEELCDDDRDDIRRACWRRCGAMQPDKLRRVDFLCELTIFEGLMRNVEDGTWEMVLRNL